MPGINSSNSTSGRSYAYISDRGSYPPQLQELVPDFIEHIPHSVINGSLPHYSRSDADHFKLTFPILKKGDPPAVWTWQN